MVVKQIATIINDMAEEMLGKENIVAEDLSNVVDAGKEFDDIIADDKGVEQAIKSLIDHIGRVVVVNRTYRPSGLGIEREAWEYGGVREKINIEMPEADTNDTWDLTSGTKYDDILVYTPPSASAKFYDKMITFSIPMSFAARKVWRTAFSSAEQLGAFIAGVENMIATAVSYYKEILERRTVNNLIVGSSNVVNLLTLYNQAHAGETPINSDLAMRTPAFLRFAAFTIKQYSNYLEEPSTQFNEGGWVKHTPKDLQHLVTLSMFADGIETYMQADVYHDEFVKLIQHRDVVAWQGVKGNDTGSRTFQALSTVVAKPDGGEATVTRQGVVAVLFDHDAAAVCNEDYRVTSFYNAGNETIKNYYKWDARYLNDFNENVVVFVVEDTQAAAGGGADNGGTA